MVSTVLSFSLSLFCLSQLCAYAAVTRVCFGGSKGVLHVFPVKINLPARNRPLVQLRCYGNEKSAHCYSEEGCCWCDVAEAVN